MKNIFLISLILLATSTVFGQKKVKGNGKMVTITRNTNSYDGINCAGSFDYVLVAGTEGNITLQGEENILEHLETYVEDGQLHIKPKNNVSLSPSSKMKVVVTIPFTDINSIALAGSGDLWNQDQISASKLTTSVAGSGDMVLNVKVDSLMGSLAGSGNVTYEGNSEKITFSIAGSGDLHAFKLTANEVEVAISGSGDAEVFCTKSIKANVSGSGDIEYKGDPEFEDINVSGSGSVKSI